MNWKASPSIQTNENINRRPSLQLPIHTYFLVFIAIGPFNQQWLFSLNHFHIM